MVGHTGSLKAAIKAVETVDQCVGKVVESVLDHDGTMLLRRIMGIAKLCSMKKGHPTHRAYYKLSSNNFNKCATQCSPFKTWKTCRCSSHYFGLNVYPKTQNNDWFFLLSLMGLSKFMTESPASFFFLMGLLFHSLLPFSLTQPSGQKKGILRTFSRSSKN